MPTIGDGDYKAEVKVIAFNEGSFKISLAVCAHWLGNILSAQNVNYAANLTTLIGFGFQVYQWVKGKPTTEQEVEAISKKPVPRRALEYYNSPIAQEAMRQTFYALLMDKGVTGLSLLKEDVRLVHVPATMFEELSLPANPEEIEDKVSCDKYAFLVIRSLSFEKGGTWRFTYNNRKINARITDDVLQSSINNGVSFRKGDALQVQLEITHKWDDQSRAYLPHSYRVLSVLQHIQAQRPASLFPAQDE